jgi:hypothetical protein
MQERLPLTIVYFNVETASDGKQHHLARPVSMVASHSLALNVVRPKDTLDGERNVMFRLSESQTSAFVRDVRKLHNEATFLQQS